MLIEFGVENFGSIDSGQTLSLVASNYYKDLPENVFDPALPGLAGLRLLRGASLYGPNASGKSTVIKAIHMLQRLVAQSASAPPDKPLPHNPFCLDAKRCQDPTKFFVAFVHDDVRFEYEVHYRAERILFEGLSAYPRGREQVWFTRAWDSDRGEYVWLRPGSNLKASAELVGMVRDNTLFVSVGAQFNNPQLKSIYDWFVGSLKILNLGADLDMPFDPGFSARQVEGRSSLRASLLALLRHADLGVVDASVEPTEPPADMIEALSSLLQPEALAAIQEPGVSIALEHRAGEMQVPIEWGNESAGTRRLFALAGPWLDILANGHTAFVDELDASLHPLLVSELLRLLFSPTTNPHGAQVVFTTHNPFLLSGSTLRRDQVWFTEKDAEGATHLYPLSDYKPRPKESLINGYLAGRYGAIPMIPPGLGI
jgi:uncharacterized protein